jgi:hypothetical protein
LGPGAPELDGKGVIGASGGGGGTGGAIARGTGTARARVIGLPPRQGDGGPAAGIERRHPLRGEIGGARGAERDGLGDIDRVGVQNLEGPVQGHAEHRGHGRSGGSQAEIEGAGRRTAAAPGRGLPDGLEPDGVGGGAAAAVDEADHAVAVHKGERGVRIVGKYPPAGVL